MANHQSLHWKLLKPFIEFVRQLSCKNFHFIDSTSGLPSSFLAEIYRYQLMKPRLVYTKPMLVYPTVEHMFQHSPININDLLVATNNLIHIFEDDSILHSSLLFNKSTTNYIHYFENTVLLVLIFGNKITY